MLSIIVCLFVFFFVQIYLKRISMILLAEKWTYKISWSFSSVQRLEMRGSCSFQWYWSLYRLSFRNMYIIVGICNRNYQLIVLTSSICFSRFLLPLFPFFFFNVCVSCFLYPYLHFHQTSNVLRYQRVFWSRNRKEDRKYNDWMEKARKLP